MRFPTLAGIVLLGIVTMCPNLVFADELGDPKPKPVGATHFNRKVFILGAAALAVSKSWDAATTVSCMSRGCYESQSRWAVGPYPTGGKLALFDSAVSGASTTGFFLTERSHKPWLRWTGRVLMSVSIGGAIRMGFYNNGVCRPSGVCVSPVRRRSP